METKNEVTRTKQKTVAIKRTFILPLTSVWKAWSEPESFKKWWGPKNFTCPDCTIDFKVGGKYVASMQDKDGKKTWATGTYKEIIPQKKIIVTDNFADEKGNIIPAPAEMPGEWTKEMLITVEFEEIEGKTTLSLTHVGIPVEAFDDCVQGWQESFDKIENNIK